MSFSSLLNQVKRKTSSPVPSSSGSRISTTRKPTAEVEERAVQINVIPKDYKRPQTVDPAVARLKEARRLEKEKLERAQAANKPRRAKSASSTPKTTASSSTVRRKMLEKEQKLKEKERIINEQRSRSPVKKLTYSELMAQAKQKEKTLSQSPREGSPLSVKPDLARKPTGYQSKSVSLKRKEQPLSKASSSATSSRSESRPSAHVSTGPKPLAKPSAKLQAMLDAKRKSREERLGKSQRSRMYDQYEEDDYDDFIVDDDEDQPEVEEAGYDRDEIWKMFSRGKSRRDYQNYDDDLSDMEATGADVEKEERIAAKRAKQEDLAEQERERRHKEEKRRRLGR